MGKLGGSKMKLIIIVGGVLLMGGFGFGMYKLGGGGKKAAAAAEKDPVSAEIAASATGEGGKEAKKEGGEAAKGEGAKGEGAKGEGAKGEGAKGEGGKEGGGKTEVSKKDLTFHFAEPFICNLLDPSMRFIAQVDIQVEAKSMEGFKKIEDNVAPLRDATLTLITSKSPTEMYSPEGKDRLKQELLTRYESKLGPGVIKEIYWGDVRVVRQ